MFAEFIIILDLIGVAVFAATGSLVASRKEMDLIGFGMMATFTGIGGGTLRDLILDRPVFWIADQRYLIVCLVIAFAVLGAEIALASGISPLVSIVLGMITATFGGLIRDLVADEAPLLLKQEIYATAALASAAVYVFAVTAFEVSPLIAACAGIFVGFSLRAGAILFAWSLPRYKQRPGRIYK